MSRIHSMHFGDNGSHALSVTRGVTSILHWQPQNLSERARIEAPKAPKRVGMGSGCPLPNRLEGLGGVVSFRSGFRGGANAFLAYLRPKEHFWQREQCYYVLTKPFFRYNRRLGACPLVPSGYAPVRYLTEALKTASTC